MNFPTKRFYYGWWVAGAASSIQFANASTAISVLTLFVIPMSEDFGWNRVEVAGATSLGSVLGATLAPFSGQIVDRFGARAILVLGGLIVALGCMYLSMTQTLFGFYCAFTMIRIADQGLIQIGATASVGKWFLRHRGRSVGLVFFGASGGVIVLAPVVQFIIANWDWRTAWAVLSGVMLCVGVIPSAALIRRRPEDMGLTIDSGPSHAETASRPDIRHSRPLSEVIATPTFWLILMTLFIASVGTSGVALHLVPHLTQQGLTPAAAVGAISVMSFAGAAAAALSGIVAERVAAKTILVFVYMLGAVSMWTLINADTLPEAYLFSVIQGALSVGANTLAPLMWASYYGRRTLGGILGMSRAAQVFGFSVGPLFSAVVFERTGSYRGAFISLALMAIVASLLLLSTRRPTNPSAS